MGRFTLKKRSLSFSERIEDKIEDDRKHILHNGTCGVGVCGEEKACQSFKNNTYTCICTHDSKPPTADGTCPRRLVPVQPGKSGKIPNVQPPILSTPSKDITSYLNSNSTPIDNSREMLPVFNYNSPIFIISIISILAILFCTYITFIFRRKYSQNHNAASPVNLKNSLLVAERYAPNPQYSACSGAGVLVLRKETLKFLNEIGEGCFGKVYKGELLCEESDKIDIVAIKVLKESATREAEEDFLREVEIMSAFRHPNILSLLGVVLREGAVSPMMVFEFMPLGDLAELLRSQRKTLSDDNVPELSGKDLLSIALQIANGMKYLAAQRFVHRDLACRNCLVAEGPIVKIADFGMSRDVYTCDYYKIGGSRLLPVRWMSPESVVYGRFTLESDIWSYGVVLWEIYSFGKQPYYGHTNEEVVKLILDNIMLIPPEDCPSLICELMKNCWKTEPRHRITFSNICDKLELAFENYIEKPTKEDTCLKYENEMRKFSTKSLPRPPPLPVLSVNLGTEDLLDGEGYLLPKEIKEPVQYLQTLPD